MKIKHLIAISILIIFSNCTSKSQPTEFDYGTVKNNIYRNVFFGIEMKLPQSWKVQSREQADKIMKIGKDLVAGDDEKMKAVIKASEINSAALLTVFKHEMGAPVDYNPNISIVAENTKNFPGIQSGKDYLFHARKFIEQGQFKYDSLDSEFLKESINGREFYKMNAQLNFKGIKIKQVYYSTIINKFSFNFIISYVSEEEKSELINIIKSLKNLTRGA